MLYTNVYIIIICITLWVTWFHVVSEMKTYVQCVSNNCIFEMIPFFLFFIWMCLFYLIKNLVEKTIEALIMSHVHALFRNVLLTM